MEEKEKYEVAKARFEESRKARHLQTQATKLVTYWHQDLTLYPFNLTPNGVGNFLRRGLVRLEPDEIRFAHVKENLKEAWLDFSSGLVVLVYDEAMT